MQATASSMPSRPPPFSASATAPAAWPKGYGELLTTFGRIAENIGFGTSDPTAGAQEFVDTAAKTLGK